MKTSIFVTTFALGFLTVGLPSVAQAGDTSAASEGEAIVVTASRRDLLGTAQTASQGTINRQEIALRPVYRASELYESIPGLVVTVHSGEGKAQQYLIRGYNLDHGTDFANFVDDMPVNRPTNTHGQGYSDLNYLIPQIVGSIDYTKGPYYAAIGDFGSVASSHTHLVNDLPTQSTATIGTDGYQDIFTGGTVHLGSGDRLLAALDLGHYDGPWQPKENFRKVNAVLRYSAGTATDGLTLTGMAYASDGGLITDQPLRAVQEGLISRFGTLDPSDHSKSQRYSMSAHLEKPVGPGQLSVSIYGIRSTMTLWNDFTHFLDDPVNGDQEEQDETRTTLGSTASYRMIATLARFRTETVAGLQARFDDVSVDRKHTRHRDTILGTCYQEQDNPPVDTIAYGAAGGNCTADKVHLLMVSPYLEETIYWTPWLRTVAGIRTDYERATDHNAVRAPDATGGLAPPADAQGGQWLFEPKASVALGPWNKTEVYFSWGRGFHSNDVRGVFGFDAGGNTANTPLLSQTTGMEVGLRTSIIPRLDLQLAVFQQDFSSELTYNADVGSDDSNGPSRRQGVEISGQYHPLRWLELNTDLAFANPRYRCSGTGAGPQGCADIIGGDYIADAPNFIFSAGALVDNLGPWSGGLQWRRLGTHSLTDGPKLPDDGGYSEWNASVGYTLPGGFRFQVSIYNLFNCKDSAADYFYQSRLPGEPAAGYSDYQQHPLEPRSARFALTKLF